MTMTDDQLTQVTAGLKDNDLKQLVMYGIGIHHAGLHERDRVMVEHLFLTGKILVKRSVSLTPSTASSLHSFFRSSLPPPHWRGASTSPHTWLSSKERNFMMAKPSNMSNIP
jgi:hypothetical protein